MKIYSITLDWREPLRQKIWVPPHSDFGLAVKIMKDGELLNPLEYWGIVYKGSRDTDPLTPQQEPIGQWGVYQQKSGEPGETLYLVDVMKDGEPDEYGDPTDPVRVKTFYITAVTTNSTVFDVGAVGGGAGTGGAKPQDAGIGIRVSPNGRISIDGGIVPTYSGTILQMGADTRVDTAQLASLTYVDQKVDSMSQDGVE